MAVQQNTLTTIGKKNAEVSAIPRVIGVSGVNAAANCINKKTDLNAPLTTSHS